jgi:hypothetical protein
VPEGFGGGIAGRDAAFTEEAAGGAADLPLPLVDGGAALAGVALTEGLA